MLNAIKSCKEYAKRLRIRFRFHPVLLGVWLLSCMCILFSGPLRCAFLFILSLFGGLSSGAEITCLLPRTDEEVRGECMARISIHVAVYLVCAVLGIGVSLKINGAYAQHIRDYPLFTIVFLVQNFFYAYSAAINISKTIWSNEPKRVWGRPSDVVIALINSTILFIIGMSLVVPYIVSVHSYEGPVCIGALLLSIVLSCICIVRDVGAWSIGDYMGDTQGRSDS